ncbi:MAG: Succinate dehydrogenase iron-sulfur protein, partial [uncultured Frankineae bacterium]
EHELREPRLHPDRHGGGGQRRRDAAGVAGGRGGRGTARLHRPGQRGGGRPRHPAPAAGHAGPGPGGAVELQGRQVRVVQCGDQRAAPPHVPGAHGHVPGGRADHDHPAAGVPGHPRPRHGRVLQLREGRADPPVHAAGPRRRRQPPHAAGGRRALAGVPQVHRVLPVPGHLPRRARPRGEQGGLRRTPLPHAHRRAGHAPAGHRRPQGVGAVRLRPRHVQHHQVLQRGLPGGHPHHRQRAHPDEGARRRPEVRPADLARSDDRPTSL